MTDKKSEDKINKASSKLDKLLLGVVIGGAVGSVVGATMSNKEIRNKVKDQFSKSSDSVKKLIKNDAKSKSVWHRLNKFFFKKK